MEKIKRTFGFILNHPLGKRHPVNAFLRFLWWQVQSSLQPSKFIVKPYLAGVNFYARKGLTGITGNIYTGLHEFNDMAFLLHFLRADDVFFDVGANAGSYTLLASGVCKAKSIAIEASVNTAQIANDNINLNQLQNRATVINAAAGSAAGSISFSKHQDTTNHIISDDEAHNADSETVKVITIDSISATDVPALIKIDVEGFETEVIKGMAVTLNQPTLKAIIIELNGSGGRYGFNEQDIHNTLISIGFNPYQYHPFKRELELISSFGSYNTIYCRDMEFINKRLKNADGFTIMGETI
jgi:FkbM family methyltransferase